MPIPDLEHLAAMATVLPRVVRLPSKLVGGCGRWQRNTTVILVQAKPAKTNPTPFSEWSKLLRCEHFNTYRTRVMRRPYCLVLYCSLRQPPAYVEICSSWLEHILTLFNECLTQHGGCLASSKGLSGESLSNMHAPWAPQWKELGFRRSSGARTGLVE